MNSPPTTLGKYQIIREIARSNDIVYEAYDPLMNRRVALKELAIPGGSTPQQRDERVRRFQREVKAAGSLANPNIVTIYEVGQDGERHFMAMEYLDGRTLRNELDTHGLLPQERAIEVAIAVLNGLEAAHSHGVIHRDIKPENIQLLDDGRVKLTDFGIARLTFEPNLTMDGQVFGTPSYMSPEQVIGKDIDARSDLFSVGAVLYEMLAGHKAFVGDTVVTITHAITSREPDPIPGCPQPIARLIDKALEKSLPARWASAKDMREALVSASVPDVYSPPATYAYGATQSMPAVVPPPVIAAHPYSATSGYPQVQPATYAYNPYGAPAMQPQNIPMANAGALPQVPIYYPPPPRRPMIKPETKHFLGRLALTLLIMGTLLGLIIVGLGSFSTAYDRYQKKAADSNLSSTPIAGDLDSKIKQKDQIKSQMRSPENIADENRALAVLHDQKAREQLGQGLYEAAEAEFLKAIELDNETSKYPAGLGELYALLAPGASVGSDRIDYWEKSGNRYWDAARLEPLAATRDEYLSLAATSFVNGASDAISTGDSRASRLAHAARDTAPNGSTLYQRAQELIEQSR